MSKQISKLKEKRNFGDTFSYQETGINQIMFMKTALPNHQSLAYKILGEPINFPVLDYNV